MTETVAEILRLSQRRATPEDIVARSFARIRAHGDPAIFITLREEADVLRRGGRSVAHRRQGAAALRHSGRGEGQHRREGAADHGGLSGVSLSPEQGRHRGGAIARGRRAHSRQDQSRSVRHRARRRAHALRDRRNLFDDKLIPGGSSTGSALAVGAGIAPLVARHRHRRIGARAGGLQQHRRAQAEPRHGVGRRRRSRLPHARLRLGLLRSPSTTR